MFTRRALIGATAAALAAPAIAQATRALRHEVPFIAYPFALGVAAGDPSSDGFVIWTRLAPRPLDADHGMPAAPVSLRWEVLEDRAGQPVAQGEAVAWPDVAHAVHVEVAGLRPDRLYFYRFRAGGATSPTGRARTLPEPGAAVGAARLGVVGCQHYEQGYFTAFRHLAREDCHAIFHYGDYIYEGDARASTNDRATGEPVAVVRAHAGQECFSVDDYRRRYAQYRADIDLQVAHASAAWIATYDDHEVQNNWVGDAAEDDTPPEVFHVRRAAAMQAWHEHMPVRAALRPRDGRLDAWRRFRWGGLLEAHALNTRAYRTDQPCGDRFGTTCNGVRDPNAEVLGRAQEDWLAAGFGGARWNALLQQVMMMDLKRNDRGGVNTDSWAGYTAPRDRLLRRLRGGNLVVLTGDEHQNFAGELRPSGRDDGAARGVEFVTTSATSGGDGAGTRPDHAGLLARNPGLKWVNDRRGYAVMDVTPAAWDAKFRVVDTVRAPASDVRTEALWRVADGRAVPERA